MRLPIWGWLIVGLAVTVLIVLAILKFGIVGTVLIPIAAAGGVMNEIAKGAGAKKVGKNKARPRFPSGSAQSPTKEKGEEKEKPARPQFNNWR